MRDPVKRRASRKAYHDRHKDLRLADARLFKLLIRYNLDYAAYLKLRNGQNGCCAICGKHESESRRALAIDHDHRTGKVRGLLCGVCNTGLGMFKDSLELLRAASQYLSDN